MAQMIYLQNRKDHGHVGQTCVCQGEGVGWIFLISAKKSFSLSLFFPFGHVLGMRTFPGQGSNPNWVGPGPHHPSPRGVVRSDFQIPAQ